MFLGQGKPVHVSEVPEPPQILWDSSAGGAYGGRLEQCLGGVVQEE